MLTEPRLRGTSCDLGDKKVWCTFDDNSKRSEFVVLTPENVPSGGKAALQYGLRVPAAEGIPDVRLDSRSALYSQLQDQVSGMSRCCESPSTVSPGGWLDRESYLSKV